MALTIVALAASASAQTVSPGPEAVTVSVYRNPDRSSDTAIELDNLNGFALVTETRRIAIPAGDGVLRFEGVASGILPESAIVSGLPEGLIEKNQDANLLSPASLLGANTGRRVHIRRTVRKTGKTTETDAVIRSGPDGAVVLQTAAGFEALQCTGLPEGIVYDGLPSDLSAKPTLSVRTHSPRAAEVTVTLSYLAANFDWQANYVATIADDGAHLDLFGWVTMASADDTSLVRAQALAVAGHVNREGGAEPIETADPEVRLQCWPSGTTTSDLDSGFAPPVVSPPPMMEEDSQNIVVTAQRRDKGMLAMAAPVSVIAKQEDLGDLKLYRIPVPVTVAAHSQKQVGLLDKHSVPITILYRSTIPWGGDPQTPRLTLRARNRTDTGLGLPLPAGPIAVYGPSGDRSLLLGEGSVADKAIGEEVEIEVADASNLNVRSTDIGPKKGRIARRKLTVANANPWPVKFEARFDNYNTLSGFSGKVAKKDGRWVWTTTVPANAEATLSYTEADER